MNCNEKELKTKLYNNRAIALLKRFEEAITWCDKGLAVSFEGIFNF